MKCMNVLDVRDMCSSKELRFYHYRDLTTTKKKFGKQNNTKQNNNNPRCVVKSIAESSGRSFPGLRVEPLWWLHWKSYTPLGSCEPVGF